MKNLLCLLLALLLMLAAPSGNLISDDSPFDDESGGGDIDDDPGGDDHPWGGDNVKPNDPKPEYDVAAAAPKEMSYRTIIFVSFFSTFFDVYICRVEPDASDPIQAPSTSEWTTEVNANPGNISGGSY